MTYSLLTETNIIVAFVSLYWYRWVIALCVYKQLLLYRPAGLLLDCKV